MKKILLVLILLIGKAFAQDPVQFKVTNFTLNGENHDNIALDGDVVLAFYLNADDEACFANIWRNKKSQSYGRIYSMKKTDYEETETSYQREQYVFTWKYSNSYDDEHGQAAVKFNKIYIGNTVKFICEVVSITDNTVLELKGYME